MHLIISKINPITIKVINNPSVAKTKPMLNKIKFLRGTLFMNIQKIYPIFKKIFLKKYILHIYI